MAFGLGSILGGGAALLNAFGGKKRGTGTPAMSQQTSGYAALPPEAQAAYAPFFSNLQQFGANAFNPQYRRMVGAPQTPFDSPELYAYQQAMGDKGAMPVGMIEPLNEAQMQAYGELMNPDYSPQGMAKYMAPYQLQLQNAMDVANRSADTSRRNLEAQFARLSPNRKGTTYSSFENQALAQLEGERGRNLSGIQAQFEGDAFRNALALRNQSLASMLGAGQDVRGVNQSMLDAARGLTGLGQYASLLGAMPNTGTGYNNGGTPAQPSFASQLGSVIGQFMAPQPYNNNYAYGPSMMQQIFGNSLFGGR